MGRGAEDRQADQEEVTGAEAENVKMGRTTMLMGRMRWRRAEGAKEEAPGESGRGAAKGGGQGGKREGGGEGKWTQAGTKMGRRARGLTGEALN